MIKANNFDGLSLGDVECKVLASLSRSYRMQASGNEFNKVKSTVLLALMKGGRTESQIRSFFVFLGWEDVTH